ncbi:PREDICTED: uncharacterized protein LOC104813511 [Tarenaya hassleriana]|uniref:uncharacterized protein LOC104813511 n=1 Tax=Tarenaya hassleriana TaxID=28532 RepID=UPI00053CA806|nr:PREDICTED: uncharacterized protein LOC104813511 [Tarenaya hassleriana]
MYRNLFLFSGDLFLSPISMHCHSAGDMAASARICCGGVGGGGIVRDRRTVIVRSPPIVPIYGRRSRRLIEMRKIRMSKADMVPSAVVNLEGKRIGGGGRNGGAVVSREKLDEWMRDSVVEIVKNLRETPLLLKVYAGGNGSLTSTEATTAAEKADDWPAVKGRWERGEERTPEGVIFVEKLGNGDVTDRHSTEGSGTGDDVRDGGAREEGTSAWGIVAQGRGMECGPVCYLLKTTRVGSGLGPVCTHFCLVKVKSFRETATWQLRNSWLVQTGQ